MRIYNRLHISHLTSTKVIQSYRVKFFTKVLNILLIYSSRVLYQSNLALRISQIKGMENVFSIVSIFKALKCGEKKLTSQKKMKLKDNMRHRINVRKSYKIALLTWKGLTRSEQRMDWGAGVKEKAVIAYLLGKRLNIRKIYSAQLPSTILPTNKKTLLIDVRT